MLEWFKKNKKMAYKITGANFLLMALVLLFWSQPKEGMSENEMAAANVARMEAKVQGGSGGKKAAQSPNFMQEHHETQKKQLRVFLILMIIAGAGFLGYGFLKKE